MLRDFSVIGLMTLVFGLFMASSVARAEKRVALVIGNSRTSMPEFYDALDQVS